MSVGLEITIYLTCALVAGVVAAIVSGIRGRHTGFWMVGSFLFPPLALILFLLPNRGAAPKPAANPRNRENMDGLHVIR
jgi:hypothetical protein